MPRTEEEFELLKAMARDGFSPEELSQRFGVTVGTAKNWISRYKRINWDRVEAMTRGEGYAKATPAERYQAALWYFYQYPDIGDDKIGTWCNTQERTINRWHENFKKGIYRDVVGQEY